MRTRLVPRPFFSLPRENAGSTGPRQFESVGMTGPGASPSETYVVADTASLSPSDH